MMEGAALAQVSGVPTMNETAARHSPRRRESVRLEAGAIREVKVLPREMPEPGSRR